jgi:pteridine reductase
MRSIIRAQSCFECAAASSLGAGRPDGVVLNEGCKVSNSEGAVAGVERVALVTGGARRVGAAIVRRLHAEGFRVAIHYRASRNDAETLALELNALRPDSAAIFGADLLEFDRLSNLVGAVMARFGRLDALINNASTYYGGALDTVNESSWHELIGSNLQAPVYLCKAAAAHLKSSRGSIVNITDIHTERPMPEYVLYNVAKSGLRGLTLALARDLAPQVRVNAVAPGPIEWPDDAQINDAEKARILSQVPLGGEGGAAQIAAAVKYLVCDASYVTGHTLNVDGGRSIAL